MSRNWKDKFYKDHVDWVEAWIAKSELDYNLGKNYTPLSFEIEHKWIESWIENNKHLLDKEN